MSTIKVDTLQTRAGSTAAVTGAGFVATDQIRGNTAANSVTVVGEGGTVTTNLQQGLAKYWVTFTQASNAVGDSFNHASATDNGTGDHTLTITNDFSSAEHAANSQHMQESGDNEGGFAATKTRAAGTLQIQGIENDRTALHDVVFQAHSWGDLA